MRLDLENPRWESLLEALDSEQRLAIPKRTHGIWDHLAILESQGWQADEWRRCDFMIFKGRVGNMAGATGAREDYLGYLNEILNDIANPPDEAGWRPTIRDRKSVV